MDQPRAEGGGAPTGAWRITQGDCVVMLAFDVGLSIDLSRLPESPGEGEAPSGGTSAAKRWPEALAFKSAPRRFHRERTPVAVEGPGVRAATQPGVMVSLFDFGAIALRYRIALEGEVSSLGGLGAALYEHRGLHDDALRLVRELTLELGDAVKRPLTSPLVEDYVVYRVRAHEGEDSLDAALTRHARAVAALLRAEIAPLAPQEVGEAMARRISYGPRDAAIIDWNAAVLFDESPEDATAALEFANVELLEVRHLDDRLDLALDEAFEAAQRRGRPRGSARVAELQTDSAMLFEGVNNAIKLLGDQYLARVYRLAAERFHLHEWDANILRKLGTLESIYQKLSDRASQRRMEWMEMVIILLIAFEVVMGLLSRGK